ncbi:MAG: hypothetical protein EXQ93_03550 [Alphaproteobacteria bacterium]|nr:hypothetical protein [Alphaproteobacteria bacterium]
MPNPESERTMTFMPTPADAPAKDKWSFNADNAGKWRWSLTTPDRIVLRASSEAYATRGDAVKNAKQYGYTEASTGTGSFPGMKRGKPRR